MKSSRFRTAYATCALWSSTDDDGLIYHELEARYGFRS